jgi:GTP cyclohydrolase I
MIDMQNQNDDRKVPIQKVGVRGLSYPITVLDKAKGVQHTTAQVDLFADLPHDFKGTHMSRFIEVFDAHRADLSMPKFLKMLEEIRESLETETAYAELNFPYFIEKKAPISEISSIMRYECGYSGRVGAGGREFFLKVGAPVQTVCPCSKAISERGAHNQRGIATVTLRLGPFFWIEDIVGLIEGAASSGVYSILKREDEKSLTERAYDNPRFVEDIVREIYLELEAIGKFPWFSVEAENFESIHNHSAYAYAECGKKHQ